MKRGLLVGLAFLLMITAGVVIAAPDPKKTGRTSVPKLQLGSGRDLNPAGKMTSVGNFPAGGGITKNGRFLWTLSAGRGRNDIRIVRLETGKRCKKGKAGKRCRKRNARKIGRVVQTIPMPGLSGGMAMAPDGKTAYVSGTPETSDPNYASPEGTPGKEGDVIHTFTYNKKTGKAKHAGVIEIPAPEGTPPPQDFPPTRTDRVSWPRDLAISPDGKTLLAALNLAHRAAIVDLESKEVRYVETGRYPYGAAITRDGTKGLVSNEADGTVSVIDLASASEDKEITVGPHLSHPEGMATDPKTDRVYVAVTHQDLVRVIDTKTMEVERSLSVGRPQGLGTAPVAVTVSADGRRLLVSNSGSDEIAVVALPRTAKARQSRLEAQADRVLQHEGRRNVEQAEIEREEAAEIYGEEAEEEVEAEKAARPVQRKTKDWELIGRVPTASYPTWAGATARSRSLAWVAAEGAGSGPNRLKPGETVPDDPGSATGDAPAAFHFKYLPAYTFGRSGVLAFPSDKRLRKLTPRASRQIRPANAQKAPANTPLKTPEAGGKFKHVFYVVRENRTYDQIFGAEPRGDGDPKLELFGEKITPNAHALAKRFPLLDHVYANSEASIDGHFWTSAAAVSDYVSKNWHQNYGGRTRPYDFGVYSVTWPAAGFLFDQAEKQGISWFNFGEAIAGTVPLKDDDRTPEETEQVVAKFRKSDLGTTPGVLRPLFVVDTGAGCFPNDASSGGTDVVLSAVGPDVEVYDSSIPQPGDGQTKTAPDPSAQSRFDCFKQKFEQQLANDEVPQFTYMTFANDHTGGTTPGRRTPNAMIAENDWALGQIVDVISKSKIWKDSLILVIEDDSQDGADHVDAHRIPAFAISPYAKRGAVIHTRYDFLSFIRTLEIAVGMKPLNLFDAVAVPMYDVFTPDPDNDEPYDAIVPDVDLTERNTESSPNAKFSKSLPLDFTDRTPQRYLDKILWQYVHGLDSEPPPPGPNASGLDEARWRAGGGTSKEEALEEAFKRLGLRRGADSD